MLSIPSPSQRLGSWQCRTPLALPALSSCPLLSYPPFSSQLSHGAGGGPKRSCGASWPRPRDAECRSNGASGASSDALEKIPLPPPTHGNQPLWVLPTISLRVSPAPLGTIKISCIQVVSPCLFVPIWADPRGRVPVSCGWANAVPELPRSGEDGRCWEKEDAGSRQGRESLVLGLAGAGERAEGREQARRWQCSFAWSSQCRRGSSTTRSHQSTQTQQHLSGVHAEDAGQEPELNPTLGKWLSSAGEQLVRKGAGGAGGHQGEREPSTCLGPKAAGGALGCMLRSVAGRWREGTLAFHSALARPPLRCCVERWAPQHRRDVRLLERAQQRAARR